MAGLTAASRPVTGAGRGGTGGERRPPAGGRWGDIRGRSAAGHRIHRAPKTAGTGCCSVRLGAIRDGTGSGRDRPRSAPGMLRRPPARPAESGCRWRRGYFCTWGGRGGECAETSRLAQERLGPGTPPPRNPRDRDRAPPPAAAARSRSRSRCVQPAPPRARLKATSVFWQRWGGGGHFAEGGVEKSLVPSPPHKATSLLGHRIATRRKILHEQGAERKLKKKKKKDFTKIMTAPRPWTVIAQRDLS